MSNFKYPLHESMRGYFAYELFNAMKDKNIWLLTADLGYKMFDPHKEHYPDRFLNCGASELTMMGIASGLAQEGKRVFTYTISSFYMRAAELIDLYISYSNLPIIMAGGGRDKDYLHDGPSHWAYTTQKYMNEMGITSVYPKSKDYIKDIMSKLVKAKEPVYLSLRR